MTKPKKLMKGVSSSIRNGVAYWYANLNGRKIYCGIGDEGKKIALASKGKEISKRYELREVQAGLKTQRVEFKSVRDLMVWYLELEETQALKSYNTILRLVKNLSDFFGTRSLAVLNADEQRRYRQHRKVNGAASSTIDQEFKILRAALRKAYSEGKITTELLPRKFITENQKTPRRIVTDEEYEKLLAGADSDFRDIITAGWETGMRISEILNLTAGQVRLDVQHISGDLLDYIHLGVFDTKTGAERIVPVSSELKVVLKRRMVGLGQEERVFTINGRKADRDGIAWRLERLCKQVGIAYGDKPIDTKGRRCGIVFHCFRHTRVSNWVKAGFSDEIVRRASGHHSLAAFQTYVKLDAHTMMRLVDKKQKRINSGQKRSEVS
jgi:integrase